MTTKMSFCEGYFQNLNGSMEFPRYFDKNYKTGLSFVG